ncbi:MAG: SpoIIE family protein phosphatase [Spirochaetota bacterium]
MTHILIIEDDRNIIDSIEEILVENQFTVTKAMDGLDGIEKIQQKKPDLILCDILMPKMDGYEVIKEIRKDEELQSIPFIFLSSKAEEIDKRYGMNLTVDDYLTKPFREQDLLASIGARLQRKDQYSSDVQKKITEAKSELNEINVQRNFLQSVLEISPDGIYIYDISLEKIIFYNPPFFQIIESLFPNQSVEISNDLKNLDPILSLTEATHTKKDLFHKELKLTLNEKQNLWLSSKIKPFKKDPEGNPLQFLGIVQDITEKKEKEKIIEEFYNNISQQLELAQITQSYLVADTFPKISGYSFHYYYEAIDDIGGDFLDFKESHEGILDIILGDVSGHGISSALVATMANLIFKMSDSSKFYLTSMFSHLHSSLKFLSDVHYITSAFLRLDTQENILYYSNAGHPPVIVISDGKVSKLTSKSHMLMLIPEPSFHQTQIKLQKGDKIILFTDGLYEIRPKGGEKILLGLNRFIDWISDLKDEPGESLVAKLLQKISDYTGGEVNDDMTILCIEKE